MKKNQLTLRIVTFISGILLGISIVGLYSFTRTNSSLMPLSEKKKVELNEAKESFKKFHKGAKPLKEVLRGFTVNKEQLSAFIALLNENPELSGFRIYFGNNDAEGDVNLVVGVNSSGLDETNTIYKTAALLTGPCPTVCDDNSSIISN